MAEIGEIINGKYKILEKIGHGATSNVYLAIDNNLKKTWAIKEETESKHRRMLREEADVLKSLDHPNIVRVVDIIEDNDNSRTFIVEDYVQGHNLGEELEKGDPSSPDDVVSWGIQLCDALQYIHTRKTPIFYKDMKPENVQLDLQRDPNGKKVRLLDFNASKTVAVTPLYKAPETEKYLICNERTDIYSLGVTLRALLMGKKPNDVLFHEDIRKFNPKVTDGLVKVLAKATNNNPDKRYQTATEFKTALENYHNFDDAVIRMKKRKLSSFRGLLAASVALFLVGAVLLPISNVVRNTDYEEKFKDGNYTECIEINSGRSDAYFSYLEAEIEDGTATSLSEEALLEKGINYTKIDDTEEKRKFVLWLALALDDPAASGSKYFSSSNYCYEDLASDFNGTVSINCYDENFVENELTSSGDGEVNIYSSIAKIRLFFADICDTVSASEGQQKRSISDSKLKIIHENINDINEWLNNNKDILTDEDLNEIFTKYYGSVTNLYGGEDVDDFYNFLVMTECEVLLEYKDEGILGDYDTLKALVNTESGYVTEKLLNSFKSST